MVCELLALVLVVTGSGLQQFDWESFALISFMVQWVGLCSAAFLCGLRHVLARLGASWGISLSYLLVLLISLVVAVTAQWLQLGLSFDGFELWRVLEILLVAVVFAGIALRYFYLQQQLQNQRQAELCARIQALQSRIRPHFLFNSMNAIASLIAVDPDTAERVVEDLSELFRASLAEPNLIPLTRELALARRYLNIELLRIGDRLTLDWQVPELPEAINVPNLLLQPLLENAIYHGIGPRIDGGCVRLVVEISQDKLQITVSNPRAEDNNASLTDPAAADIRLAAGNGMALDNIRQRLAAHYGDAGQLLMDLGDEEYVVRVILPLQ